MAGKRLLAILLMTGGVLALVYGGFNYTMGESSTHRGPMTMNINDRQRANVPIWVGVVAVALGGALLLVPGRRS